VRIGDTVLYDGRLYVLRGLDPMSVPDRQVSLEDTAEGGLIHAPLKDVERLEDGSGFDSEGLG
jgi:hypothetical protein